MELTVFIITHVAMIITAIVIITSGRDVKQKASAYQTAKAASNNNVARNEMVIVHKNLPYQPVTDKLALGQ